MGEDRVYVMRPVQRCKTSREGRKTICRGGIRIIGKKYMRVLDEHVYVYIYRYIIILPCDIPHVDVPT
jgi:hypothetical protein